MGRPGMIIQFSVMASAAQVQVLSLSIRFFDFYHSFKLFLKGSSRKLPSLAGLDSSPFHAASLQVPL